MMRGGGRKKGAVVLWCCEFWLWEWGGEEVRGSERCMLSAACLRSFPLFHGQSVGRWFGRSIVRSIVWSFVWSFGRLFIQSVIGRECGCGGSIIHPSVHPSIHPSFNQSVTQFSILLGVAATAQLPLPLPLPHFHPDRWYSFVVGWWVDVGRGTNVVMGTEGGRIGW